MNELATFGDIMNKQIYALTDQHSESTMTLKEITDILGVRHDDAMKTVETMAQSEAFGMIPRIKESSPMPNGGFREIETYKLTKRQSIAVAAKLNTSLLMHIIVRWQLLEDAEALERTAQSLERTAQALERQLAALAAKREARTKLQQEYRRLSVKRVQNSNKTTVA